MNSILLLILMFLLIFITGWGFLIKSQKIIVKNINLKIKELPEFLKEFKIVHLTDLHSFGFGKKEKRILKILEEINPDLIFITGDIISKKTADFNSCAKFWRKLSEKYQGKIFGVYGNHDIMNPQFQLLDNVLKKQKINILRNESNKINIKDNYFYLIGVDDPHLGYDDVGRAMEGINELENKNFKIFLAHSPEIFRKIKNKNIDLVLVGHTHGCQINIPFLCDLIVPLKYDKKYQKGLFRENSTYMYVNSGIGETFLPIRINAPSEIALITFKQSK